MSELKSTSRREMRLLQALTIAVSLALILLLAALVAMIVAIDQQAIPPPAFSVRLGQYELIAPCPRGILCDGSIPFYAIWWGEPQPNGRLKYRQLFFVYLKSARERSPGP